MVSDLSCQLAGKGNNLKRVLIYYAHPGHRASGVNRPMAEAAESIDGITFVDLYLNYPRHDVNVAAEQERLLTTDIVLFQFPVFWYSTPSIIKDWQDLVLQHGFAYGSGGDRLAGKHMMLAVTAAGPQEAYARDGFQHYPLRTFLTPLEQTARLCQMNFPAPYVLFSSLKAPETDQVKPHVDGYVRLIEALRDEKYDFEAANVADTISYATLPIKKDG
ncbi:MAG: NAD(P)H-dependent oxidoreductase [Rhizobiaceae bacterium]